MDMIYIGLAGLVFFSNALVAVITDAAPHANIDA